MPPRLSMGSINALFASHHFVVPTILDKLSSEAVNRFVGQLRSLKKEYELDLEFAGVVGTMTRGANLSTTESEIWGLIEEGAEVWRPGNDFRLGTVQRRALIANAVGDDIAYLLPGPDGEIARQIFDPVFEAICLQTGLIHK